MIRPIDIRLNAAHPELPLAEAVTFTGSPSTVLIRGVPPNCGRWAITAVSVAATFPDGSTTTRAAVQSANGVWVATLPATARSGRTENGLRVMADGIDENGEAVTGYILGVADFAVASLGVTPAPEPGETSWQMLYFDAVPGTLRKGDVAKVDGVLKLYNGTAWEAFATPPALDDAVTRTSANGVKSSGIWSALWGALTALPAGFASLYDWCVAQLAGKASTADATLTERGPNKDGFSAWTVVCSDTSVHAFVEYISGGDYYQLLSVDDPTFLFDQTDPIYPTDTATSLAFSYEDAGFTFTATRTALPGYQLGNDDQHILASEAEAKALRNGKLDKGGGTMSGNLTVSGTLTVGSRASGFTIGTNSVAEGIGTIASGDRSHAEGGATNASGNYSHAEGLSTSAQNYYEHAQGIFNASHTGRTNSEKTLSSIGFGVDSEDRKNAVEVMRDGKTYIYGLGGYDGTNPTSATDLAAAVNAKANRAEPNHAGNLAALDASGNPADAGWTAGDLARYSLVTKTIDNGAVTLDDRAINAVAVSSSLASLTVNFPTATSGKARDFGLRLTVASGITTAPQIVLPQGVVCENADGEAPEIGADGAATILYFTETASGVFLVKGEVVQTIS